MKDQWNRRMKDITFVVIFAVKKLDLFKRFGAWIITNNGRMHWEERVKGRRAGLLRSQNQEAR